MVNRPIDALLPVVTAALLAASAVSAAELSIAPEAMAANPLLIATVGSVFDPLDGHHPSTTGRAAGPVILQFGLPPTPKMKEAVVGLGVRLHHYLPNNAFLATLPDHLEVQTLTGRPEVRWVGDYLAGYKFDPGLLDQAADGKEALELEVHLLPGSNAIRFAEALRARVGSVFRVQAILTKPHRSLVRLQLLPADLAQVVLAAADHPDSVSVARRLQPELHNDHSVWVVQSYDTAAGPGEAQASVPRQYPLSATVWHHGLIGDGETVAVADSGMNQMCFFERSAGAFPTPQQLVPPAVGSVNEDDKVIAYYVEPGAAAFDHAACSYHGTHVSGSVAGDNRAHLADPVSVTPNHDVGDGMAPAAKLVMQDVGAASGFSCSLSGLSGDLTDMFEQAYAVGARIHTNSWGATTPTYTTDAADMDEMMWRREDIVFTVSMGNSGVNPGDSSIGAPGTAKNIISVGGVSNGSSGSRADDMTTYSRGPTHDGRLKPDVVTPAYSVNSADGGGSCSTTTKSGTSMAAPTTAGALALAREYFVKGYARIGVASDDDGRTPSGALLKAALANGAMPLGRVSGYDPLAGGTVSPIPSMDQGWGRTHLEGALYFAGDAARVRYWDVRHRDGVETGESVVVHVDVPADTAALAVTLAWSDPPSATSAALNLVNDLDLEVESPDREVYLGNVFGSGGWSVTGGGADGLNPIEGVRIEHPGPGTWTLRVRGSSVPGTGIALNSERQGFALVASFPECASPPLAAPQNLSAADSAPDGVTLNWDPVAGASRYLVYKALDSCPGDLSKLTFLAETSATEWLDSRAYGGYAATYRVAADDGCSISPLSDCAGATFTGPCSLRPAFAGAGAVTNASSPGQCGLLVSWVEGSSNCPLGPDLRYNVYRSTDPLFDPSAGDLLATTTDTGFLDLTVFGGVPTFYVVRAEDGTSGGEGPHGGNEEENLVRLKGVPWSGTDVLVADFEDDGGDTSAWMDTPFPWTITSQQNATPGGQFSYHSAVEGENYPAGTCSAVTTPPLILQAGLTHQLRYQASYNIEVDWDGVVVEISTDGGQSWTDLPPDAPSSGYPGDFSETGNPPINACGYSSSHGAFNGPQGNAGLTAWTEHITDLAAFDGETVLIRWRFSTDPGSEFEGFYLDDIVVTNVRGPGICANPTGGVEFDASAYACSASVGITVRDAHLVGAGSVDVEVASASGDSETVTLAEVVGGNGRLDGTISASADAALPGNGQLEVSDGGEITVTYIDADDGHGGSDVPRTDMAAVDCSAPDISAVAVETVEARAATVAFTVDETAWWTVRFGASCTSPSSSVSGSGPSGRVNAQLAGLLPSTAYLVSVVAVDGVGNLRVDDNGGSCYPFTTLTVPVFFTEQFGTGEQLDLAGWSVAFTPDGSADGYSACAETIQALPVDPAGGTVLALSDDDSELVSLTGGSTVWLYGQGYPSFYVGSNGYLTFGASDSDFSETLAEHFDTPRVSALFDDLNPASAGTVSWKQLLHRVVVTWAGVPEYSTTNSNTFQVELWFDGTIVLSYLDLEAEDGIAGLSSGSGLDPDFGEDDLNTFGMCARVFSDGFEAGDTSAWTREAP